MPQVFLNRSTTVVAVAIVAGLCAILWHPFLFESKGHYFYPVFSDLDPRIFADDPDVDGLRRFRSAYYSALGWGFRIGGVTPESVDPIFRALYILSRLMLAALVALLALAWTGDLKSVLLLLLWSIHPRAAPVGAPGDVSWFMPALTHLEIALLFCLAALVCWLRLRRPLLGWLLLAVSVLVHPLVTLQLVIACSPFLLLDAASRRQHLVGAMLFGAAVVATLLFMSPPSFTEAERAIFLRQLLSDQHVAPQYYSLAAWMSATATAALALVTLHRYGPSHAFKLLGSAIAASFAGAVFLSVASIVGQSVFLMQFQPLRLFLWVNFFAFLALAIVAPRAWAVDRATSIVLFAVVAFWLQNSLWLVLLACLALTVIIVQQVVTIYARRPQPVLPALALGLASAALAVLWFAGGGPGLPGARSVEVVTALSLAGLAVTRVGAGGAAAFVAAVLVLSTIAVRPNPSLATADPNWLAVQHWSRQTPPSTRFFTPLDQRRFRLGSLRTTVNEPLHALVWVDPTQFAENAARVAVAHRAYAVGEKDIGALLQAAFELRADYIVFRTTNAALPCVPAFESGPYLVVEVRSCSTLDPAPTHSSATNLEIL